MTASTVTAFDAIQEAYDNSYWLKADRLVEELKDKDGLLPPSWNLTSEQDAKFTKIIKDVADARNTDKAITTSSRDNRTDENDDRTLSTDADGVCVEYRSEEGKDTHSFAITASMEFSLSNIVPIMFESDLLPNMMPKFMGLEVAVLEERGRFGQLIYQKIAMPPPFRNRYMVIDCQAVDCVDERGGFLIIARSEDPADRILPPSSKGAVMMDVHFGGTICRVTSPNTTDMCTIVNVDPKIAVIPKFLLNFMTRKMMWHAFRAFQKKAHVFQTYGLPPQYAERVEKNRERIYDEVTRRLNKGVHIPNPLKVAEVKSKKKKKKKKKVK